MSAKIKKFMMLTMSIVMLTGCGINVEETKDEITYEYVQEAFGNIEPLEELTTLNIGVISAGTHESSN